MTVLEIYEGSNGDATKGLFNELQLLGPAGELAINLFRAQKASARAKVYRGGRRGFKGVAYDKKGWAIGNICDALTTHGAVLGMRWGWQPDPATEGYPWVIYVDLPTGQVSFHAASRGKGPDYDIAWDGHVGASAGRVVRYIETLLEGARSIAS